MKVYPAFIAISSALLFSTSAFATMEDRMPHIGHPDQGMLPPPPHKIRGHFPPMRSPNMPPNQAINHEALIQKYYQAANSGNSRAQVMLGLAYLDGVGVPKSSQIAKEWFKQACENGYQKGCNFYRYVDEKQW